MEIRKVPVSMLNPAAYNPRKNLKPGDAEYQKLARSLDKFGCVEPVVWNERTGNVVGGHQRLKVLIAAGETELDVSVVNLSDADEKAHIRHFKREIFERRQAEVKAVIDSRGIPLRAKTLDYCTNASICATICKRKYERAAGPQE